MAITKLMCIKPSTGANASRHLNRALHYITNPEKTEQCLLVGSNMCMPDATMAYKSMMQTKRSFDKRGDRQGYHFIISFPPTEQITAMQAMDVAKTFVERYLGKEYEALYSVHTDQKHMHIHIVFNSVSCIDGHKYHYVNGDWKRYIQPIVNEICADKHLSTLDLNWSGFDANMSKLLIDQAMLHGKRITKEDWLEKKAGIHTWAEFAAADIDALLPSASCFEDVMKGLQELGWQVRYKTQDGSDYLKHFSMRPPADACNKENNHAWLRPGTKCGYGYSREGIEQRIKFGLYDLGEIELDEKYEHIRAPRITGSSNWPEASRRPITDYQRKYFAMLYRTGQMARRQANRIPMEWRTDVRQINETRKMVEYMFSSGLETEDQVVTRKEELQKMLMRVQKEGNKDATKLVKSELKLCEKLLDMVVKVPERTESGIGL